MKFYKSPKWVRYLEDEQAREVLLQVAKKSAGDFDRPRKIVFVLDGLNSKEKADNAVHHVAAKGWNCTIIPQTTEPITYTIEAFKDNYQILEHTYREDVALFRRIADMYQAIYSGWKVSLFEPKKRSWTMTDTKRLLIMLAIISVVRIGTSYVFYRLDPDTPSTAPDVTMPAQPAAANMLPIYHPDAYILTYDSKDMGLTFKYPNDWDIEDVSLPCHPQDGTALNRECEIRIIWKDFNARYVPTMTVARYNNSLEFAEAEYDKLCASYSNTTTTAKTTALVAGVTAIKYTRTSGGETTKEYLIPAGNKVYLFAGSTPRGSVRGLDYFVEFDKILDTFKTH